MLLWNHQGVRWALGACLTMGLALTIAPAGSAQTADGVTPAEEDICTKWGLSGKVNGLCNAYCEAMDCDSAEPHASEQACTRVLGKIEAALGDTPFPTCNDADDDGVPNGSDNCPDVPNTDQADDNPNTPEGNACEVCPCAETWSNGTGAPDITTQDLSTALCLYYDIPDEPIEVWSQDTGRSYDMIITAGGTDRCFDKIAASFDSADVPKFTASDVALCRTFVENLGCSF